MDGGVLTNGGTAAALSYEPLRLQSYTIQLGVVARPVITVAARERSRCGFRAEIREGLCNGCVYGRGGGYGGRRK